MLVARREKELRAVAARCAGRRAPIVADVTSRDEVRRVVREAIAQLRPRGRVGQQCRPRDHAPRLAAHRRRRGRDGARQREVGVVRDAGDPAALHSTRQGTIINVSSMLGRMPMASFRSAYNGAKHFLNAITANLRDELREQHPGIVGLARLAWRGGDGVRRQRRSRWPRLAHAAHVAAGGGSGRGDRARDRHAGDGRVHARAGCGRWCWTTLGGWGRMLEER